MHLSVNQYLVVPISKDNVQLLILRHELYKNANFRQKKPAEKDNSTGSLKIRD